jgi:hypothetical protein
VAAAGEGNGPRGAARSRRVAREREGRGRARRLLALAGFRSPGNGDAAAARARVILLDHPGFGKTEGKATDRVRGFGVGVDACSGSCDLLVGKGCWFSVSRHPCRWCVRCTELWAKTCD